MAAESADLKNNYFLHHKPKREQRYVMKCILNSFLWDKAAAC
jgi:hypothetical protein